MCPSRGDGIHADEVGIDLWAIGIMILRLFTKNHNKIEDIGSEFSPEWSEHAYRKLFDEVSIYLNLLFIKYYLDARFTEHHCQDI